MNTKEPEPITGAGILWAIGQINKRFKQAAKPVPERKESEEEQAEEVKEN